MRCTLVLRLILVCLLFQAAACFAEAPPDPPANDAILDAASALGNPSKNALRTSIATLFKGAGIPLGIITLSGRRGYVGAGQKDGTFALALLEAWHAKQPERRWDRGVVVVFFKTERSFWIQPARGLASSLTMRDLIDSAAENMRAGFRTGKYAKAIEDGAAQFSKEVLVKKDMIEKETMAPPELRAAVGGGQAALAQGGNPAEQTTVHHFVQNYESAEGKAVATLWEEYRAAFDAKDPKRQLDACDRILNTLLSTDLARWETEFYRRTAWYNKACAHAMLGQAESAFVALKASAKMGYDEVKHMETDTDLNSLRADARYADFMKDVRELAAARRTLRGVCMRTPVAGDAKNEKRAWLLKIDIGKDEAPGAAQTVILAPDSKQAGHDFWEKIKAFAAKKTPVAVEGAGGMESTQMVFTVASIKAAE